MLARSELIVRELLDRHGRLYAEDAGTPVGVVSIGDLALDNDARSALSSVSSAQPNS